MKRVQVILEEWQHDWLVKEAAKQGSSNSALLRQLLTEAIERRQAEAWEDDPIWGMIGIAEGPDDGITSANLDDYLYQANWHNQPNLKVAEDDSDNS